mgnify:CR=1 FL=1
MTDSAEASSSFVIDPAKPVPAALRGAVLVLGNFDGVHRGHQQVIAQAAKAAMTSKAPLGVISFDPHPRRLFRPSEPAFKLMTHAQQARGRTHHQRPALCAARWQPPANGRHCKPQRGKAQPRPPVAQGLHGAAGILQVDAPAGTAALAGLARHASTLA